MVWAGEGAWEGRVKMVGLRQCRQDDAGGRRHMGGQGRDGAGKTVQAGEGTWEGRVKTVWGGRGHMWQRSQDGRVEMAWDRRGYV